MSRQQVLKLRKAMVVKGAITIAMVTQHHEVAVRLGVQRIEAVETVPGEAGLASPAG
jgi:hypothetical protein